MAKNINYGVVGVGHLGKFHVQQINRISKAQLCGVYDIDYALACVVAKKNHTTAFKHLNDLLAACDAISVVVPTPEHCQISSEAIKNNCHVFIEKPIADNVEDAKHMVSLAKEHQKKILFQALVTSIFEKA